MKTEQSFDSQGRDSLVIRYSWDQMANKWMNEYKAESFYDNSTNTIIMNQYLGMDDEWLLLSQLTTYRSGYTISGTGNYSQSVIRIYPNPAKDFIQVDIDDFSGDAVLEIYNVQGKKVLSQYVQDGQQVFTHDLPKGLYVCKITGKGIASSGKLVIE